MCYLLRRSVHTEFYIFHAKGLFMSKVKSWCRANAMLVISLLAAVVTAFFVPPDRDYLGYYDLKTLACLFCVLAVVGALRDLHIFSVEMSRNVQSGNTQNLKSMVIQRSFPKWSVAERRKTAAASDQAAVCACAHSRYFTGGSPSGLRV